MRILVACEKSGMVRDAFSRRGHDAWSCDIEPSEVVGKHLQMDVREVLGYEWDMLIAFPPCTYLTYAGARWFNSPGRLEKQLSAARLFIDLANAAIPKVAVENPRGVMAKMYRKPDDCIQPYYFGHKEKKTTYLWLRGLPALMATFIDHDPINNWTTSVHGGEVRSRTFSGVANAMAQQWG